MLRSLRATLGTASDSDKAKTVIERLNMSKMDDEISKIKSQLEAIVASHNTKTSPENFEKADFTNPPHIELCFFFIKGIQLYFDVKEINRTYRANQVALKPKADEINRRIIELNVLSGELNGIMASVSGNATRREVLNSKKRILLQYINVQIDRFKANGYTAAQTIRAGGRRSTTRRKLNKRGNKKTRRH